MPIYKIPAKKIHHTDEMDGLIVVVLAIVAVPAAAWMLAAALNAAIF